MTSPGIRSGVNWMRPNFSDEAGGEGAREQRLGDAGHALEQDVAVGQQATSSSSMAASWPTTTLRSCCFSRSPTERIVSRSMQHLPFPAIEVARNMQQAAIVGACGCRRKLGLAASSAGALRTWRALPIRSSHRSRAAPASCAGAWTRARDIGERRRKIAPEDLGRVAAELQQPRGIADEGRPAGLERRLDGDRRSEPAGRRPQQNRHRRQRIDRDDDDRELEQRAPDAGIMAEAVDDLVDDDRAACRQQLLHHADGDHGIVAMLQPFVGDQVGIGQHPQPAIAVIDLAEQHAQIAVDDRRQAVRRHQLRLGETRLAAVGIAVPIDLALHDPGRAARRDDMQDVVGIVGRQAVHLLGPVTILEVSGRHPFRQYQQHTVGLEQAEQIFVVLLLGRRLSYDQQVIGPRLERRIAAAHQDREPERPQRLDERHVTDRRLRIGVGLDRTGGQEVLAEDDEHDGTEERQAADGDEPHDRPLRKHRRGRHAAAPPSTTSSQRCRHS